MKKLLMPIISTTLLTGIAFATGGCGISASESPNKAAQGSPVADDTSGQTTNGASTTGDSTKPDTNQNQNQAQNNPQHPVQAVKDAAGNGQNSTQVVAEPASITVMVNKQLELPTGYRPEDLIEPNVPFIFKEKDDRRLLRKEAAKALETLFAAAEKDNIHLAGVSGFRSYETQQTLFSLYIKQQGEELARKFSAEPGHSEHQTGLAMDVTGSNGKCAAEDCFAGTPEAKWIAEHASEYGFVVRYPKGKESITGYNYEPWHIRYIGTAIAKEVAAKGITLEEYYTGQAVVKK